MTMDALAEEMGISKRTIYERFRDKDTLLLEVIMHYKKIQEGEARKILEEADNAIEAMFRMMRITIRQVSQMNPLFFHDFKKYHTKVFQQFSKPGEIRDYSITRMLLEKGLEQSLFREDMNVEIVNRTLHELFNLFGHDSSLVEAGYHRKDLFDHCLVPYLRGISTPKGMATLDTYRKLLE
jgi:hypothetical protein